VKTLASLDQQSVPNNLYEVVVAIEGSTDVTLESVSNLHNLAGHERHERLLVKALYTVASDYLTGGASLLYERTYRASMAEGDRMDEEQFRGYGREDFDLGLRVAELGAACRGALVPHAWVQLPVPGGMGRLPMRLP